MIQLGALVDQGHPFGGIRDPACWPWSWHRLLHYYHVVKSVHERAAMDRDPANALPPRWMWWDGDELDAWFDERREAAKGSER